MTAPWDTLLIGTRVDGYEIVEHLGGGGFCDVFRIVHDSTGDSRALKVLNPTPDSDASTEFEREARLLTSLQGSSNVVAMDGDRRTVKVMLEAVGSGVPFTMELPCIILELADCCLEELICAPDDLALLEKFRLWRAVVLGVHQMHMRNVVHRDMKSANCLVFVGSSIGREGCKVSDLGRSRSLGEPPVHALDDYVLGRGDLRFAPPEFLWAQGDDSALTHRCADLYGLGSVLFEIIVGVGISSLAINPDGQLLARNQANVRAGLRADLSSLRSQYERSFDLFESALPRNVASYATSLLRVLCDPVPAERLKITRGRKVNLPPESLEWLLRRIDIVIKRLEISEKENRRPKESYGRR
ncbi:protein kinase [Aeromicrobium sp. IC_218]|uniref:protein kinase domain-containing protein n=1 Tax=Aeromicrobium sp. IC_218 TaxID=2545468 RepID=UPI00103FEE75|nr:protein kinase [Aeromicrobium sp. IC_218]TCJ00143.1 hypothetical protein E0W78_02815 [Aeromicrobium sp. IC_218]